MLSGRHNLKWPTPNIIKLQTAPGQNPLQLTPTHQSSTSGCDEESWSGFRLCCHLYVVLKYHHDNRLLDSDVHYTHLHFTLQPITITTITMSTDNIDPVTSEPTSLEDELRTLCESLENSNISATGRNLFVIFEETPDDFGEGDQVRGSDSELDENPRRGRGRSR